MTTTRSIGYEFVHLGKMMESIQKGVEAGEALKKALKSTAASTSCQDHQQPAPVSEKETQIMALFESYERRIARSP